MSFWVATPYHVILCNFRSLFYFIHISVNSWYLNKPDEDWYWPVEISQLNSISRCLISPWKSLLGCNVFSGMYIHFFRIQHLASSDFRHCTCNFPHSTFNFSHWTFTRWSATDGDRGLDWLDLPLLKWRSRVGRETSHWSGLDRPPPLSTNQTSTTTQQ